MLAGAITLSASALMRAWREGAGLSRVAGVAGLGVSILCTSALVYYCFFLSYGVPDSAHALPSGEPVPQLTLNNERGKAVNLAALAQGDVVLVFYRGFW